MSHAPQPKAATSPVRRLPAAPPVYKPVRTPAILQTKMSAHQPGNQSGLAGRVPVAPPVSSSQPTQKVLQAKGTAHQQMSSHAHRAPTTATHAHRPPPAPSVSQAKGLPPEPSSLRVATHTSVPRTATCRQPSPKALQPKINSSQPRTNGAAISQPRTPPVTAPQGRQPRPSGSADVVQATKFYPNLHPGAVEPVERSNIFRLESFANQYRLHRVDSHGVNVPNQQYNFVRTSEGQMLLHSRYRHPSIAEGKQVLYAGEIFFNNGKLQWWSNGSGHYQPDIDDAEQANLPMDYFFSYQQIIKGEHTRKKR